MQKLLLKTIISLFIPVAAVSAQTLQDEMRLKQYFEGKQVIVKIDMPATKAVYACASLLAATLNRHKGRLSIPV